MSRSLKEKSIDKLIQWLMWKEASNSLTAFSSVTNRHVCFSPTWSNPKMTVIDVSLSITAAHIAALIRTLVWTDTHSGSIISRHTLSITLTMYRGTRSWRSVKTKRKSERGKKTSTWRIVHRKSSSRTRHALIVTCEVQLLTAYLFSNFKANNTKD